MSRSNVDPRTRSRRRTKGLLGAALLVGTSATAWAIVTDLTLVRTLHEPAAEEHGDQLELLGLVQGGQGEAAFELAFATGNELFETVFNALDGVGANVGRGQRFTRVPRADLDGAHEWANHVPARETGPNAESCTSCHSTPADDGSGLAVDNVHRDPRHSGRLGAFIERNTPHTFAPGAVQRLSEEMTAELQAARDDAAQEAARRGQRVTRELKTKGISFGRIVALPHGGFDTSKVEGLAADLVVRPFQWKGSVAFLRDFNRGASHNEIGMQAVELVGDGVDGDGDGVADEMTIGDQTSLAVYLAAQPRPTTLLELDALELLEPPLTADDRRQIRHGFEVFGEVGCASCHVPRLLLEDPVFHEPSAYPAYRDERFPAGQDPLALGVDPRFPVSFDLTADQPDNRIEQPDGSLVHLGSLRKDARGRAVVELFGDLKRHEMGHDLAESIDEVGTGASVFLTENLWGVGTTSPYLHDGRATTLTEAILEHGGEAKHSREAFQALATPDQQDLIAFLGNLVLFKLDEPDKFRGGGHRIDLHALQAR